MRVSIWYSSLLVSVLGTQLLNIQVFSFFEGGVCAWSYFVFDAGMKVLFKGMVETE
jgi:hypothetical protein